MLARMYKNLLEEGVMAQCAGKRKSLDELGAGPDDRDDPHPALVRGMCYPLRQASFPAVVRRLREIAKLA